VTARAALAVVLVAAGLAYAVRLDAPAWRAGTGDHGPPRYLFDESYTAFTAHRLVLGDATVFVAAARRQAYLAAGAADLSPTSRGEWSHPPGAPLAIAVTTSLLGFTDLGARAAAVCAALIALVATAALAGPRRAWLACVLVGFDGAYFVFARTAMPHMLLTAGVTAGAALLVGATAASSARRRWALAALGGAALGFALSVRWTAIGAAVMISVEGRRHRMAGPLVGALGAALVVYVATYVPWLCRGHGWDDLVALHRAMLAFHARMPAAAGQSTPPYAWPWTLRPVTFAVDASAGVVRGVWCVGGRCLWWGLVPALIAGAWRARQRRLRWLITTAAIGGTWLPWAFLGRFGMTYYLLPALPFAAVALADLVGRVRWRGAVPVCVALVLGGFAISYPILAAVPLSRATFARYAAVLGVRAPAPAASAVAPGPRS
jgi:dolichyl-phosphate-mannose-protein mannosyltransferase